MDVTVVDCGTDQITVRSMTAEELAQRQADEAAFPGVFNERQRISRLTAYQTEADPLFFGWQRGLNTQDEWIAKVDEVKERFPYMEAPA